MKKQLLTAMMMVAAISLISTANPVFAQAGGQWGNGPGEFIDENGDGFNDLAPDADGDGIPNSLDEDYVRPQDGSGAGYGGGEGHGSGNGPADGSGNRHGGGGNGTGVGPGDGTGSGDCIIDPVMPKSRFNARMTQ